MHTGAGGIQGTGGDLSVDDPGAHPANDEDVQPAPPELPAQALKRYRQTVLELLHAGETVPAALRCLLHKLCACHLQCLLLLVGWFVLLFVRSFVCFVRFIFHWLFCLFVCLLVD